MTRSLLASFLLLALTAAPALAQDASGTDTGTRSSPADGDSTGTTGSSGSSSTSDVATEHGATRTSSSTTTRSGAAPARTEDASQAPVIDPVTAPPAAAEPEEEEEEGDGRDYDVLWIEVQGGVSYANLIQFQNQNFADVAGGASVFNEV